VWPNVLGTCSTVLGALALLYGAWGIVGALIFEGITGLAATNDEKVIAVMKELAPYTITSSAGGALLGAVHLTGGILLLRRRRRAVPVLVTWSMLKIAYAGFAAWVGYATQERVLGALAPAGAGAPPLAFARLLAVGTGVVTLLWLWAYPCVLLLWFSRDRVKAKVQEWQASAAEGSG
jgi:hypothetical protein